MRFHFSFHDHVPIVVDGCGQGRHEPSHAVTPRAVPDQSYGRRGNPRNTARTRCHVEGCRSERILFSSFLHDESYDLWMVACGGSPFPYAAVLKVLGQLDRSTVAKRERERGRNPH